MSNRDFLRVSALAAAVSAAITMPAYGFEYKQGDFYMQVDTTVSVGASWRASNRDYQQIGALNTVLATGDRSNAHKHGSSTADNANLNYQKGSTFSELFKITMDMELNYKNYGAFVRGKAFYDHRIVNGDGVTDTPAYYDQVANQLVLNGDELAPNQSDGRSADILDAFVWGDWWLGDKPVNVRLGRQVISWGEGIFFANGINSINPVDVNALLVPGSEVKDALIPLGSLYGSIGLTSALTLEAFYMLEWKETELPACGTYFSPSDLVGPGCYNGFVPYGMEYNDVSQTVFPAPAAAVTLPRVGDHEPDNGGEYGVAVRYFAESIETEISLYYMNLHSRLPVISGHYADMDAFLTADPLGLVGTLLPPPGSGLTLEQFRDGLAALPEAPGAPSSVLGTAYLLPYGDYYLDYVEDIALLGASFSTAFDFGLPGGATAVSGEISMRKDQPFALEDGDSLAGAVGLPSLTCYDAPTPYDCYSKFDSGDENKGYVEADYYQAEIAFIHFFDQILGAARWTAILDIAGSYTDLPDKDKALLNSSYNATLSFPNLPQADSPEAAFADYEAFLAANFIPNSATTPEQDYYPTSGAWGYKMRFTGDYNNVLGGVNLRPTISFSHDVSGNSASPVSNFLQNRKALGLSLEAVLLNDYSVKASYTDFYGAEPYNQLADRDYYSLSATASF
ncbi:MAG TPA: hypothetical protein DEP79_07095 [Gammaproteobacteria bacterium]|nr:hypothetical protein [Gammaproteobacteria bacterium]